MFSTTQPSKAAAALVTTIDDDNTGGDQMSVHSDSSEGSEGGGEGHVDESNSTTSFGTSKGGKQGESTEESSTLAKAETRAVNRSKMLVLAVLFMAATAVGAATYVFAQNSEQKDFQQQFHDFAIEIEELVHHEARNVFLTVSSFSSTLTSYALASQAKWPHVTLPHMEVRGLELNSLSNSILVGFAPYVQLSEMDGWEVYANYQQKWIQEGLEYNYAIHQEYFNGTTDGVADRIHSQIHHYDDASNPVPETETGPGPFLPVWQLAPAPHDPKAINYNLLANDVFQRVEYGMQGIKSAVLSEATDVSFLYEGSINDDPTHPHSFLLQPVYEDFGDHNSTQIVGVVFSVIGWDHYFEKLLPPQAHGIVVVMKDTCGGMFSYQIDGAMAVFLGYGDHHDNKYNHLEERSFFSPGQEDLKVSDNHEHCEYFLHIYPSQELEDDYTTNKPLLYTCLIMLVFLGTVLVFVLYDYFVNLRNQKVTLAAKKSNAVVKSLFPKNVRDRLMQDIEEQIAAGEKTGKKSAMFGAVAKAELKNFLDHNIENSGLAVFDTKPIADLFPNTTVMFGDIAGFTAWSSVREPTQVFSLLETLYHAFDETAKRRRVFKVETIGDCYVAVSGLPEPRKDHATVMARFARDCLGAMNDLTKKLEITLGPDTGDLSLRIGLHSGPVTAGVLRGDKSRFQLFGDTVNTAARMESNGLRNKIHVSSETAELLKSGGKGHWLVPREEKIHAKGKGSLQTYWLDVKIQSSGSARSGRSKESGDDSETSSNIDVANNFTSALNSGNGTLPQTDAKIEAALPPKIKRLVKWNADVLLRLLKQVMARRDAVESLTMESSEGNQDMAGAASRSKSFRTTSEGKTCIDEVKEIIELPSFDPKAAKIQKGPNQVQVDPKVVQQLHDYVTIIASMYRPDVPFHNFEHASHVTMSVTKLLSRIVTPDTVLADNEREDHEIISDLHDHTYGITSDPLTQFAVVFSALIHDVDHTGAPNAQLIKEQANIAEIYSGKSIAEQNSVDLAWNLLMDTSFTDLRKTICETSEEQARFRQLVVNVVLATDIVDKDLKQLRNARWEKAFHRAEHETATAEKDRSDSINRKATIVLEHLIQASDISHTMQHWHIYRKWNEMFYQENLVAYHEGRAEKDPTEFWYKGEIGFFDFYIIPLAKKLKECGVFGVSCDEYLNYALANRKEWVEKGEDVVAEYAEKYKTQLPKKKKEITTIEEEEGSNDGN